VRREKEWWRVRKEKKGWRGENEWWKKGLEMNDDGGEVVVRGGG
jgi:hypothetical protein